MRSHVQAAVIQALLTAQSAAPSTAGVVHDLIVCAAGGLQKVNGKYDCLLCGQSCVLGDGEHSCRLYGLYLTDLVGLYVQTGLYAT